MPPVVERRAQDLHAFEYHLANVLVAMRPGAALDVSVQYEDIHGLLVRPAGALEVRRK
jgi:hypothetical protein